jgi:hypothetical protein
MEEFMVVLFGTLLRVSGFNSDLLSIRSMVAPCLFGARFCSGMETKMISLLVSCLCVSKSNVPDARGISTSSNKAGK